MADPNEFTTAGSFTKGVYRDVYPAIDPKQPALSKAGKVVMITGASRGIGVGAAEAFAHAGAKAIIITARKADTLKSTEEKIRAANAKTEVLRLELEITDESAVAAAFESIRSKYGKVDILVNNAGLFGSDGQELSKVHIQTWWTDFDVNVRGTAIVTKHFLSVLGTEAHGKVVFVSSAAGVFTPPGGLSAYSISKLAGIRLAEFTAIENPNVQAVAINPGIILTDMTAPFFVPFAKDTTALFGGAVNWASSNKANFLNGRFIYANWDVAELEARKDEIVEKDVLKVKLAGDFQTAEVLG